MSCKSQNNKLRVCGLNLFIVFCVLSGCKANNYEDRGARFFDLFSGMQMLSERHCNTFCGPSRFFVPLTLQKKYCQMKCQNSTIANLSLENGQSTTSSKPETSSAQPDGSSTNAAGSQSPAATVPATTTTTTTNQPTSSNVASTQSSTTPVPTTEGSTSESSPSTESSETTEAAGARALKKRSVITSAVPTIDNEQIALSRFRRENLA